MNIKVKETSLVLVDMQQYIFVSGINEYGGERDQCSVSRYATTHTHTHTYTYVRTYVRTYTHTPAVAFFHVSLVINRGRPSEMEHINTLI